MSIHSSHLTKWLSFAETTPLRFIQGAKNCRLAYRHFIHSSATPRSLVILVNGRAENILKWSELAQDFYQKNYDVLLFDHRGQGYSQRLLADSEKGYLDQFCFYADDLATIVNTITAQYDYHRLHIVSHSLGALISSFYLANNDHRVQSAVFSAPFFGVPLKHPIRDEIIIRLMNLLGFSASYVFGKTHFKPVNPNQNLLSGSQERMALMNEINLSFPELRLGGPTFRWVNLCIQAVKQLPQILPHIDVPILVLQAEKDKIVSNKNLKNLTALLPQYQHNLISNAKHEILFERDDIRGNALAQIFQFIEKNDRPISN